eukprot:248975-Pyramimonas_sp.AAC.1
MWRQPPVLVLVPISRPPTMRESREDGSEVSVSCRFSLPPPAPPAFGLPGRAKAAAAVRDEDDSESGSDRDG